jgi:hypothetical protein
MINSLFVNNKFDVRIDDKGNKFNLLLVFAQIYQTSR